MRDLTSRLVVDTRQWTAGLRTASSELSKFEKKTQSELDKVGSEISRVGAALGVSFSAAAITQVVRSSIAAADALGDAAAAAGLGVEEFQRLRHAMSFSGIGAEEFAAAMGAAARQTGAFLTGQERASKAFRALGVDAHTSAGGLKSQEQILQDVIEQLGSYGTHEERVTQASRIFGESIGPKIVAFAEQGIGAIDKLKAATVTLSDAQVRAASAIQDRWEALTAAMKVGVTGVTLELAKALELGRAVPEILDLPELNRLISEREQLLARHRAEDAAGNKKPLSISQDESELERLTALRSELFRKRHAQSPEGQAEAAAERDRLARETEAARKREADAKEAATEQKKRDAEIERNRKQAKRDSYKAEEKELLTKYRLEEELATKQAELELQIDKQRLERQLEEKARQQELYDDLARGAADTFADLATNGERAWERLRQRALAVIAEVALRWAASKIGVPGLGAGPGGSGGADFGALLVGALARGFAAGGSPPVGEAVRVGESGPEWFVPRTAGTIIPSGRAGLGGTTVVQPRIELPIEVSVEPGMTVTQRRRRDIDGRERARITVRSAMADDQSRGGGVGGLIAAETGSRRAPRRGIS